MHLKEYFKFSILFNIFMINMNNYKNKKVYKFINLLLDNEKSFLKNIWLFTKFEFNENNNQIVIS